MKYGVYIYPTVYERVIIKLSSKDHERIDNIVQKLIINPYVGDVLQ